MISLLFASFLSLQGFASPLLSETASYPVNPEWKEASPSVQTLKDARYNSTMSFTSFDSGSDKPSFTNQTVQSLRWKKLQAKGEEKFELLYEDYRSKSKVQIFPGMPPMETSQDYGIYLSSKPLKISAVNGAPKKIDNIDTVRGQLSAEVKDPAARQALMLTFQENILLDGLRSFLQENSCLKEAGKRIIGDSWKTNFEAQGIRVSTDCRFDGWAEAAGRRVMVIGVAVAKSVQETRLPMGKVATVETSGGGKTYFDPKSGESLAVLEMNIVQLPPASDPKGASGLSKMQSTAHGVGI